MTTAVLLVGCSTIRDEIGVSGGFVSPFADKVIVASSQREQVDRYVLATLVLVPLALDTSGDAAESRATSDRVNELYGSLSELYAAVKTCSPGLSVDAPVSDCRFSEGAQKSPNGYSFETLSYEVQSDLYYIGRSIVTNLDLDEEIRDLVDLSPTALVRVARTLADSFPVARRAAATYRDGTLILADAVAASCSRGVRNLPIEPDSRSPACRSLESELKATFTRDASLTPTAEDRRQLSELLRQAQTVARREGWRLQTSQYSAIVDHIDRACKRALFDQVVDIPEDDTILTNCGDDVETAQFGQATIVNSSARDEFVAVVATLNSLAAE